MSDPRADRSALRGGHGRRPWSRRLADLDWPALAVLAASAVAVVWAMGPGTLTGARVFSAVDVLNAFEPWRTHLGGEASNTHITDPINAILPKWDEMRERVAAGDLPLWSSLVGGGVPLITLLQRGTLSVLNVPSWLAAPTLAPALVKLAEVAAAVWFTLLLCRRLGLSRAAGLLAGVGFALCGFQTVWQGWQHTQVGALIPAVLWATEYGVQELRASRGGGWAVRLGPAVPLALATGAILLAGFPSVAVWAVQAAGVWALVRVVASRRLGWRDAVGDLAVLAGGVAAGLAVAGVQLVPFVDWFTSRSVTGRAAAFADAHLRLEALATMVMPESLGNVAEQTYWGGGSFIEQNSYVGLGLLGLALLGAVGTTRGLQRRPGARWLLVGLPVVLGLLVFRGGLLLDLVTPIPPYGTNLVARQRVLIAFFVAVLAGVGLHGIRAGFAGRLRGRRLLALVAATAATGALFLLAVAEARGLAQQAGAGGRFMDEGLLPALVGVAAAAGGVLVLATERGGRRGLRGAAAVLLAGAVIVQGAAFGRSYWSRSPAASYFPSTPAHDHLTARLGARADSGIPEPAAGGSRLLVADRAFEPATTVYYGIPSVTYHGFQVSEWADLMNAVQEGATARSTFPMFEPGAGVATSPIMDRLAAAWYAAPDTARLIGEHGELPAAAGTARLSAGQATAVPAPTGGDLRGVTVRVPGIERAPGPDAPPTDLHVRLLGPAGTELAAGWRRLHDRVRPGPLDVGLVWGQGPARTPPPGSELELAVTGGGAVTLGTAGAGGPAVAPVVAGGRPLELARVGGVHLYRRTAALPRIRWAADARVIGSPGERVDALASGGLPDDTAVLSRGPAPPTDGQGADLEVLEAAGDAIEVDVQAAGAGLLVVPDSLTRDGWRATVDGRVTDIVPADHAGAAVPVPAGGHTVRIVYDPVGWKVGGAVSLVTLLGLAALWVLRRRRPA